MAEKRYYWLKLKRDFFKRHDIQIIEAMQNGKDYILFYLKLLCESIDHDGSLRFSEQIPYNDSMLATITNTNIDVVRSAVKVFTELGMMELLDDGTYFMSEVERMVGSAADNDNANRQRRFRERRKALALSDRYDDVTKNNESKSIDKEKDTEIEIESRDRVDYQQIVNMYNETCVSFPSVRSLSDARKKAIKARLKQYKVSDFEALFKKAEASTFLKGGNGRNWSASFDWLIKDGNMAKVLDGNYDDKGVTHETEAAAGFPNSYTYMTKMLHQLKGDKQ